MATEIHLRLTGKAEEVMKQLTSQGLTPQDVIARGLWILDQAITTNRVVRVNEYGQKLHSYGLEAEDDERTTPPVGVSPTERSTGAS